MDSLEALTQGIPLHILHEAMSLDVTSRLGLPHQEMSSLLSRSVLLGGKRLRPLLTFVMGEFLGVELKTLVPYARAIELVHAASLCHDDVIDEATERRGSPSINQIGGNKRAVLVGDYLLADVILEMCEQNHPALLKELSLVIQKLSLGEWLQMDMIKSPKLEWDLIEQIAICKTASVMSYCCLVGAYLSKLSPEKIEASRRLGLCLGLAFQFIDDTLDFDLDHFSGKNRLQDLNNGLISSVVFEIFRERPDLMQEWQLRGSSQLEIPNDVMSASLSRVRERAKAQIDEALSIVDRFGCDSVKNGNGNGNSDKALRSLIGVMAGRQR